MVLHFASKQATDAPREEEPLKIPKAPRRKLLPLRNKADTLVLGGATLLLVLVGTFVWLRTEAAPSSKKTEPSLSVAPVPSAPVVGVIPSPPAPPNPAPPPPAPSPIPNASLRTAASTQAAQWEEYTFGSNNLIDGDPRSSWQPVQTGKGPGEWFMLKLSKARTIAGIEIWNGFQRQDRLGELYHLNSRIKRATLELSDGAKQPLEFEDVAEKSTFLLTAPHVGITWVKVTVHTVYTGDRWDDLAVSEVRLLGMSEPGE